jgi:hypothetical protein
VDTTILRRRTAAAVLAASCAIGTGMTIAPASAATAQQANVPTAAPANVTPPAMTSSTGWFAVGAVLTADPGTWDTEGLTFAYQWRVAGVGVSQGDTYTPVAADLDKPLTVTVTATKDGQASEPATSESKTIEKGDIHYVTLPSVIGDPRAGEVLTADPGTWDVPTAVAELQWYVDGNAVDGATAATYRVRAADVDRSIYLGVILNEPSYYWSMAFTDEAMVQRGTLTSRTKPIVAGTPVVGTTLRVTPGTWSSGDEVTLSHQWTVDGKPVAGATGPSFTLPASAAGKRIGVVETAGGTAWVGGSQSSTTVTATKAPATVQVRLASPARGRLKVTVVVRASVTPTGRVKVVVGHRARTVTLRGGKATFTVAGLARGKVRVTARYAGSSAVGAGADAASIRVR